MFKLLVQSTRNTLRSLQHPVTLQKCSYRPRSILYDDQEEYKYKQRYPQQQYKSDGNFSLRDFMHDNSHGETGTLHTKFIKYIALENCKFDLLTPQTIKYSDYFPITDLHSFSNTLRKTPTDQLSRLLVFAFTFKTNGDIQKVVPAINQIDSLCEKRLPDMSYDEILSTLYYMMFVIPKQIVKTKFYKAAMPILVRQFEPSFNKHVFVQLTFYIGLWKKGRESTDLMHEVLQTHLMNYLDQLSRTDLAIVSNSAFRTSVLIENKTFLNRLIQETTSTSMEEDALLVTFVKSLRLNKVKEEVVYDKLKKDLASFDLKKLYFKGLVHFFAYFSDGLWNDPEVCRIILEECISRLTENTDFIVDDMRAKDVTTLLWSFANLDVNIDGKDLEFLENIVISKVRENEFKYKADELIECCLSLWMLGLKSKELLEEIQSLDFSLFSPNNPSRVKLNSRMRLLLSCVEIESPDMLKKRLTEKSFNESKPAPSYLLKSENLRNVNDCLSDEHKKLGIQDTSIVSPITELNIAGILVKLSDDTKCFVEVVDKELMMKFEKKPSSLIILKKRLLEAAGYRVVLLTPNEYSTKDALIAYLSKQFPTDKLKDVTAK